MHLFLRKQRTKKGQQIMSIPFGLIFSIILIIAFLVTAALVIKHFLGLKECTEIGSFIRDDLERTVDDVWRSTSRTEYLTINIPSGIEKICFVNLSEPATPHNRAVYDEMRRYRTQNPNVLFYPPEASCDLQYFKLAHIDIERIISTENPYCIDNKGTPKIKVEKGFYDSLVSIERA